MSSIKDILGPWEDPNFDSSLIERCRNAWEKELDLLTNEEMATFLRQNIAASNILPLAKKRIAEKYDDNTEMYDGELQEAIEKYKENR
ncbi:MAG: contact-dependent growth inhibition system immunity protein [Patescibacteria group bacterium]|jgi:hypothetical protein